MEEPEGHSCTENSKIVQNADCPKSAKINEKPAPSSLSSSDSESDFSVSWLMMFAVIWSLDDGD